MNAILRGEEMDTFNIVNTKNENNKYPFLVISTCSQNPLDDLLEVEIALGDYSGPLLFDLLASNGHSPNRFIEGEVTTGKINTSSLRVTNHIDSKLKQITFNYFMENIQKLEDSVLSRSSRFLFKKGVKI